MQTPLHKILRQKTLGWVNNLQIFVQNLHNKHQLPTDLNIGKEDLEIKPFLESNKWLHTDIQILRFW